MDSVQVVAMLKDGNMTSQDNRRIVLRHLRHHFGKNCFDPEHQIQMMCAGHSEIVVDTMEYAYEDGGVKEICKNKCCRKQYLRGPRMNYLSKVKERKKIREAARRKVLLQWERENLGAEGCYV